MIKKIIISIMFLVLSTLSVFGGTFTGYSDYFTYNDINVCLVDGSQTFTNDVNLGNNSINNIKSINISQKIIINNASGEGSGLELYSATNKSYAGVWYYPDPTNINPQVALTTHKVFPETNATHEHFSIYTTDSSYNDRLNRISLDYGKDIAPLEFYNVELDIGGNNIFDVGSLELINSSSNIDFNDGELLRVANIFGSNNEGLKLNGGTNQDIIFRTRDGGGILQTMIVLRDGTTQETEFYSKIDMLDNPILNTEYVDYSDGTIGTGNCGVTAEGRIIYDSTNKKHYGCNSTTWVALY